MKARVHITLKDGVLDPQGKAIQHALGTLGFAGVNDVRQGKYPGAGPGRGRPGRGPGGAGADVRAAAGQHRDRKLRHRPGGIGAPA